MTIEASLKNMEQSLAAVARTLETMREIYAGRPASHLMTEGVVVLEGKGEQLSLDLEDEAPKTPLNVVPESKPDTTEPPTDKAPDESTMVAAAVAYAEQNGQQSLLGVIKSVAPDATRLSEVPEKSRRALLTAMEV